jgi:hypothetical protein
MKSILSSDHLYQVPKVADTPTLADLPVGTQQTFENLNTGDFEHWGNNNGVIEKISGGGGAGGDLDATLTLGNTTDLSFVQEDMDGITRAIRSPNYLTDYGAAAVAMGFAEYLTTFDGVNTPDTRPNVVYSFGYNVDGGGGRINSNEAAFRFGYESNYNINTDTARRGFEFHLPEITTKEGNVLRLWSMYTNKSGGLTELNSQIENLCFMRGVDGSQWLTFNNSDIANSIKQYGNEDDTYIETSMTNPSGGRITTRYSSLGAGAYEYTISADSPTGKIFTTNMRARFDNVVLSTSYFNISNTSATGDPSQPTLRLDHANSGTEVIQDWYYNASLVMESKKDYSLLTYKPVILYYGGTVYRDLTLNYSFGGNLKLVGLSSGTPEYNLSIDASGYVIQSPVALTNSATLNFGNTAAGAATDLTITVTGAADGDAVALGVPNGSTVANGSFTAWVSATDTVTVRFSNSNLVTALDPASGTFKVRVFK